MGLFPAYFLKMGTQKPALKSQAWGSRTSLFQAKIRRLKHLRAMRRMVRTLNRVQPLIAIYDEELAQLQALGTPGPGTDMAALRIVAPMLRTGRPKVSRAALATFYVGETLPLTMRFVIWFRKAIDFIRRKKGEPGIGEKRAKLAVDYAHNIIDDCIAEGYFEAIPDMPALVRMTLKGSQFATFSYFLKAVYEGLGNTYAWAFSILTGTITTILAVIFSEEIKIVISLARRFF